MFTPQFIALLTQQLINEGLAMCHECSDKLERDEPNVTVVCDEGHVTFYHEACLPRSMWCRAVHDDIRRNWRWN